ncbi:MAG: hypothetical protein JWQ00_653 [Noviherbaspirillum sp.]|nr:hypothetical protein [Noviherbaspirillum sp.]
MSAIYPDDSIPLGNMTAVELSVRAQKKFLQQLLHAAGDSMTLSELPLQDAETRTYLVPKPLEDVARRMSGLAADADWKAAVTRWGAAHVNILSTEAALRLLDIGRVKAVVTHAVAPWSAPREPVPQAAEGPRRTALPLQFQGPFDWHLEACGIPQAWSMFAESGRHTDRLPWKDIRIAHIDTGFSEHVALGWANGSSVTVHPQLGYDFFEPDADARDPFLPSGNPGHGTRTSSVIAGFDPAADGKPFYGAAPGVMIIPYRVTDSVLIDHVKRLVAQAIEDALTKNCDVISISLGALFGSSHLASALDHAYEKGVIVVCAAGNYWSEVIYPGRYNRCVTMGGTGPNELPWGSSAAGQYVDLCGPAQQIRRVEPEPLPPGQAAAGYTGPVGTGTSYATTLCAGMAALWLAWHGEAQLNNYPQPWMTAAAFKKLSRESAYRPAQWDTSRYGSGILRADALLKLALPMNPVKALPAGDVYDPND